MPKSCGEPLGAAKLTATVCAVCEPGPHCPITQFFGQLSVGMIGVATSLSSTVLWSSQVSPALTTPLPQTGGPVVDVVLVDVVVVVGSEAGRAASIVSRHPWMSGIVLPSAQEPALVSAALSLASLPEEHPGSVPGLAMSLAVQASSAAAVLPTDFVEADGHLPVPGTSASRVD